MTWRCCITDPPELGKKVLCWHKGDCFVGMRFDDYYVPMPFVDHPLAKGLVKPEKWQAINFPPGYTGHIKIAPHGDLLNVLTMDQLKLQLPDIYRKHADIMIAAIGSKKSWDHL